MKRWLVAIFERGAEVLRKGLPGAVSSRLLLLAPGYCCWQVLRVGNMLSVPAVAEK